MVEVELVLGRLVTAEAKVVLVAEAERNLPAILLDQPDQEASAVVALVGPVRVVPLGRVAAQPQLFFGDMRQPHEIRICK